MLASLVTGVLLDLTGTLASGLILGIGLLTPAGLLALVVAERAGKVST